MNTDTTFFINEPGATLLDRFKKTLKGAHLQVGGDHSVAPFGRPFCHFLPEKHAQKAAKNF